jgi:RHS repeat-associated protein
MKSAALSYFTNRNICGSLEAFGSPHLLKNDYRHSFNGMENVEEITGSKSHLDFGARIYDSRLGRWFSLDMVEKIHESGYAAFGNNPIFFKDLGGNDTVIAIYYSYQVIDGIQVKTYSYEKIEETSGAGSQLVFHIYEPGMPKQEVNGWKSPTNPNGLDQTSGVGAQLSQTTTKYDANGRAKTAKSYEMLNMRDESTWKYWGNANKKGAAINGFGYVLDLDIQFNMGKVNLTRTDLVDLANTIDQLDKVNKIILKGVQVTNPITGGYVTIRNVQVVVTGYHSPEPSPYNPPSGTQANTEGKTGNDALDVNRAASVAKYISNATGVTTSAGSGGVGTRRTTVTVMGKS